MIKSEDIVVEFGAGLGIAASRVHKKLLPKRHICYEANLLESYSQKLFSENNLNIELKNFGLGDGSTLDFGVRMTISSVLSKSLKHIMITG